MTEKDEWIFVMEEYGAVSVIHHGTLKMLVWCATNLVMHLLVCD